MNNQDHLILQQLLRTIRHEAGLSQTNLAALLNKPQSFISKYESGERRLDIIELRQICCAMDVSLVVFITRLEQLLSEKK